MKRLAFLLCMAAFWCGCSFTPKWKEQTFAFATPAIPPASEPQTNVIALSGVLISPVFQSRSFIYRVADDAYEQDPYACFLISPERALAESIQAYMRSSGVYGHVEASSGRLSPDLVAEVSIEHLYGDFRNPAQPVGALELHFLIYQMTNGMPGRIVLDKMCARTTPLARKSPAALMAAWDTDLREIMEEINSDYAKAHPPGRG
jgi:hypothetical protein